MSIDWWTLGIQAVNVLILVWLLRRFFWRPVADIIEKRRDVAQQTLAQIKTQQEQATQALADIEQVRKGFDQERQNILVAAEKSAAASAAELLAAGRRKAAIMEEVAKAALEKERIATERAWAEQASQLAVEIARRLVARLGGRATDEAFLSGLLDEVRKLQASVPDAIATNGGAFEAVSASTIDPSEQERYRHLIGEALGARPEITFNTDPALIAGLQLRGPHLVVNNNWRADLADILASLQHDK